MDVAVRPVELLLIDDLPADVALTRDAFIEAKIINNLHVVENAHDAMAYLQRAPPFANATLPDLIFLDLKLLRKSGEKVLDEIKGDQNLRTIPLVVLSSALAADDARVAYGRADGFIIKPVDLNSLIGLVGSIAQFWLCLVKVPRTGIIL